MKARCDSCHAYFHIQLKEEETTFGIVRTYMQCPYCKQEYDVSYDNSETFPLRKKIQKRTVALKMCKTQQEYERQSRRIKREQGKLQETMEQLRKTYQEEKEKERHGRE